MVGSLLGHVGRDLRNYHLTLSVLLASLPGSGGGAGTGRADYKGATNAELRKSRNDVVTGMLFSNLIMYFIILTTAATLHTHGKTVIMTAQDAAEGLKVFGWITVAVMTAASLAMFVTW